MTPGNNTIKFAFYKEYPVRVGMVDRRKTETNWGALQEIRWEKGEPADTFAETLTRSLIHPADTL